MSNINQVVFTLSGLIRETRGTITRLDIVKPTKKSARVLTSTSSFTSIN